MKVNAIVVEKIPPAGIERYYAELLPSLSKYVDLRTTTLKIKETTKFSRPIGAYLSLWLQRSNIYREDGEIVHALGILPFHQDCIDVLNIYDMTPWKFLGMYQQTFLRSVGYGMILQAVQAAPKIITMSKYVKRDVVQMCGKRPEDIFVVPGGVNFEKFHPLDLDRTARTVLFVGEDNPRKNIGKLIEGLSLCSPPPQLIWAGRKCWPAERKSIVDLAARLRVPLTELGYIPDQELLKLYNRVNLLVYPTLDEGGALPALEAMACGLPVATSEIPVLKEALGQFAFYFDPLKPHDIARAIQKGLKVKDSYFREEMVQYVRKNFSWDSTARMVAKVYKEIGNES